MRQRGRPLVVPRYGCPRWGVSRLADGGHVDPDSAHVRHLLLRHMRHDGILPVVWQHPEAGARQHRLHLIPEVVRHRQAKHVADEVLKHLAAAQPRAQRLVVCAGQRKAALRLAAAGLVRGAASRLVKGLQLQQPVLVAEKVAPHKLLGEAGVTLGALPQPALPQVGEHAPGAVLRALLQAVVKHLPQRLLAVVRAARDLLLQRAQGAVLQGSAEERPPAPCAGKVPLHVGRQPLRLHVGPDVGVVKHGAHHAHLAGGVGDAVAAPGRRVPHLQGAGLQAVALVALRPRPGTKRRRQHPRRLRLCQGRAQHHIRLYADGAEVARQQCSVLLAVAHSQLEALGAAGPHVVAAPSHVVVVHKRHQRHEARQAVHHRRAVALTVALRDFKGRAHVAAQQRRLALVVHRHRLDVPPLALLELKELAQPAARVAGDVLRLQGTQLVLRGLGRNAQLGAVLHHQLQRRVARCASGGGGGWRVAGQDGWDLQLKYSRDLDGAVDGPGAQAQRAEQSLGPVDAQLLAALVVRLAAGLHRLVAHHLVVDGHHDLVPALGHGGGGELRLVRQPEGEHHLVVPHAAACRAGGAAGALLAALEADLHKGRQRVGVGGLGRSARPKLGQAPAAAIPAAKVVLPLLLLLVLAGLQQRAAAVAPRAAGAGEPRRARGVRALREVCGLDDRDGQRDGLGLRHSGGRLARHRPKAAHGAEDGEVQREAELRQHDVAHHVLRLDGLVLARDLGAAGRARLDAEHKLLDEAVALVELGARRVALPHAGAPKHADERVAPDVRSILQVVRPQRVQLRQRLLRQHVAVQRRLYERPPLRGVLRCFRHLEGRHFHLPLRQEAAIPGAHFPARGQKLGFVVHRRRGPQQHLLGGVQAEVAIHDAPRRRRLRFARLE
mmetsp:Transcript_17849/g.46464  ORF Transcript_17849/g.46464 Transcript_17849/m.46464 type:complete len:893 (+) Transcript_17849:204-2882(+)